MAFIKIQIKLVTADLVKITHEQVGCDIEP